MYVLSGCIEKRPVQENAVETLVVATDHIDEGAVLIELAVELPDRMLSNPVVASSFLTCFQN
jgi:hypothetical protein